MESLLEEITISSIYLVMIVFCRVGSLIMTLPGIGESYVAIRYRLLFSLILSIILAPTAAKFIPTMPNDTLMLFIISFFEILIGIFYGIIVRILINTTQIVGMLVSSQSSLGSALFFDPNQGSQGAIVGNFYAALAITLFFTTNLHHMLIQGILESFQTIPPGKIVLIEDTANAVTQTLSGSFITAFKISSPVVILSILMLVGGGILSRLMPGIQVFFILTPAQILASFFIVLMTISGTIMWYLNNLAEQLNNFFIGK